MRRFFLLVLGLVVIVAVLDRERSTADEHAAMPLRMHAKVDQVRFTDAAGKHVALADLQGKKATVVVFLSFDCPVCTI